LIPTLYLASLLRYYVLSVKHIPIVTALDGIWGSFGGTLGVMAFVSKAPLAAAEGRHVRYKPPHSINGRRYCSVWTVPLKMH